METITGLKESLVPMATLLAAAPTPAAAVAVGEAMATMTRAQADITRWDLETRPALQAEYDLLRLEVRRLADEGGVRLRRRVSLRRAAMALRSLLSGALGAPRVARLSKKVLSPLSLSLSSAKLLGLSSQACGLARLCWARCGCCGSFFVLRGLGGNGRGLKLVSSVLRVPSGVKFSRS